MKTSDEESPPSSKKRTISESSEKEESHSKPKFLRTVSPTAGTSQAAQAGGDFEEAEAEEEQAMEQAVVPFLDILPSEQEARELQQRRRMFRRRGLSVDETQESSTSTPENAEENTESEEGPSSVSIEEEEEEDDSRQPKKQKLHEKDAVEEQKTEDTKEEQNTEDAKEEQKTEDAKEEQKPENAKEEPQVEDVQEEEDEPPSCSTSKEEPQAREANLSPNSAARILAAASGLVIVPTKVKITRFDNSKAIVQNPLSVLVPTMPTPTPPIEVLEESLEEELEERTFPPNKTVGRGQSIDISKLLAQEQALEPKPTPRLQPFQPTEELPPGTRSILRPRPHFDVVTPEESDSKPSTSRKRTSQVALGTPNVTIGPGFLGSVKVQEDASAKPCVSGNEPFTMRGNVVPPNRIIGTRSTILKVPVPINVPRTTPNVPISQNLPSAVAQSSLSMIQEGLSSIDSDVPPNKSIGPDFTFSIHSSSSSGGKTSAEEEAPTAGTSGTMHPNRTLSVVVPTTSAEHVPQEFDFSTSSSSSSEEAIKRRKLSLSISEQAKAAECEFALSTTSSGSGEEVTPTVSTTETGATELISAPSGTAVTEPIFAPTGTVANEPVVAPTAELENEPESSSSSEDVPQDIGGEVVIESVQTESSSSSEGPLQLPLVSLARVRAARPPSSSSESSLEQPRQRRALLAREAVILESSSSSSLSSTSLSSTSVISISSSSSSSSSSELPNPTNPDNTEEA